MPKKITLSRLSKATKYTTKTLKQFYSGELDLHFLGKRSKGYEQRRIEYLDNAKIGLLLEDVLSMSFIDTFYTKDIRKPNSISPNQELDRLSKVGQSFGYILQEDMIEKYIA